MSKATIDDESAKLITTMFALPIVIGIAFVFGIYFTFANGYVASCIWDWYAVPLGAPRVAWKTFAAAAILVALFRVKMPSAQPKDERTQVEKFAQFFGLAFGPWLSLFLAWVIR